MPYIPYVENPPATFATPLASQDVFANPGTLISALAGGGGGGSNSPPNFAPSIPSTISAPAPTSISVNMNISSVGGVPRPTDWIQVSQTNTAPWTILSSSPSVNNFISATASNLAYNTAYAFQSVASNSSGILSSPSVFFSTVATAPSPAPGVPSRNAVPVTSNSISISFVANTSGAPAPTFSTLYGTTNPPTNFWPTVLNSGTSNTYSATVSSLTAGTNYYFASYASNPLGNVSSVAALFSTVASSGSGPNVAPSIPLFSADSLNSNAFTYSYNISSVTGSPTPTFYSIIVSSNNYPSTIIPNPNPGASFLLQTVTNVSTGTYGVYSVASNASGVSTSVVSYMSTLDARPPSSGGSNLSLITATSNSIYFSYNTVGITASQDELQLEYLIGTTSPPTGERFVVPRQQLGNVISTVATGLSSGTTYYLQSYITNTYGSASSITVTALNTVSGSNLGPNIAPTVPALVSANSSSITFSFDTDALSAVPSPSYYALYGSANPPTSNISNFTSSGTVYTGTATGLLPNANYYFQSVASNVVGVSTSAVGVLSTNSTAAPTISNVSTVLGVGFLTFGTAFSSILLDTSQNVSVGNWNADGTISYSSTPPGGVTGPQYLSALQAAGNKIVLSIGGASDNPSVLSSMFGLGSGGNFDTGAQNLANSLAYAYFGGSPDNNPLGFARTDFEEFAFDGVDLDIEAVTPSTTTLKVFASTLKANPAFANKIITAAPQTPYLTQGANSALNANGTFSSFSQMNPASVLNAVYTGNAGNQASLLSPTSGNLIDYHFIQAYNNSSYSYPTGATNGNWNNVVAAWGIQSLQAGYPNKHPKNIYAFATTDGTPLFDPVADAAAFNTSLSTANSTIRAFSTTTGVLPYSSVTVADWCAGIGFWAANTSTTTGVSSPPVLSTLYGQPSTLNNMPTRVCMTYGGVFNSANWGLYASNVPVPNARGY